MQLFNRRCSWGVELSGFGRPFGLGEDHDGRLLVTDMDCHVVIRLDADLQSFVHHDGAGGWSAQARLLAGVSQVRPELPFNRWNGPHSVAVDAAGRLILCCYYQPMIVAVRPDGHWDRLIGAEFLSGPATARIDEHGRILVAEYSKNLVLAFDADGQYLECVGGPLPTSKTAHLAPVSKAALPSSLIGKFDRPHMVICRADGSLLVADTWNNRLQHFSPQGHAMIWPESSPKMPCPVAVDEDAIGRVLVTCWGSSQVLLFQKNGCEVPLYGMPELNKPYDARFYRNGMVVADSHNGRVLIFDQLPTAN